MSELHDRLARRGGRGEGRGAPGDGADPVALAPVAVLQEHRPAGKPRSRWRVAIAVAGVAALLGVTTIAVTAIGNHGGATSPEGAVRALARAIDAGDPLAAVDVIAPDEVRSLRPTVGSAERKAADLKVVNDASAPLRGVDLSVNHLDLATEQLADGYVKVHVTNGTISARTDRRELSPKLQRVTEGDGSTTIDLAGARPFDTDPFVVAIRRDGHWYVSAAYTLLEYVRAANHLPAAAYGSGAAASATLGADTPEAAATDFVRALSTHDWTKVFSLIPPTEIPLYDYRTGLSQLFAQQDWHFSIANLSATAETHGDTADVHVTANGTYPSEDKTEPWRIDNTCITATTYEADTTLSPVPLCLGSSRDSGMPLYGAALLPYEIAFGTRPDPNTHVRAVRVDGRWYLSPVVTADDVLDNWVRNFNARSLAVLLQDYADIPSDGTLTLNKEASFHADTQSFHVFEFAGTKGQQVVLSRPGQSPTSAETFTANLIGTNGRPLDGGFLFFPIRLPADGTYRVVITTYKAGDDRFTLWDAKDAPKSVLDPFGGCNGGATSSKDSMTCYSSSSSSSSQGVLGTNTVPPTTVKFGG